MVPVFPDPDRQGPAPGSLSRAAAGPRATVPQAGRAPAPPAPPAPPALGPQVAFILDGDTDAALPGWLRARAVRSAGDAMGLAGGGALLVKADAVADYLSARAAGRPALLVYDRLDTGDATALERIAARARRDGAVAVLVAPDAALWTRLGAWLEGPARDLVPVSAATLLN